MAVNPSIPPRVASTPAGLGAWMRWVESNFAVAGRAQPGLTPIVAGGLAGGALDGFQITSPYIQSSAVSSGLARWLGDAAGIHFYDSSGNNTINLDAATGTALITGSIQNTILQGVGSASTVVGGPLPAELIAANYSGAAIVWYSSPANAGIYNYGFISHIETTANTSGATIIGYVDASGVVHQMFQATVDLVTIQNQLTVSSSSGGTAVIAVGIAQWRSNANSSYITDTSSAIDKSSSYGSSGTTNGVGYSMNLRYLTTYDRVVNIAFNASINSGSSAGGMVFSGAIPSSLTPLLAPQYGSWSSNLGSGVCILNGTGIVAYTPAAGTTVLTGSFTYVIAKQLV